MKAYTIDTEAAHAADSICETAEPKLVRPSSLSVFVRAVLLLPLLPTLVFYYDVQKGCRFGPRRLRVFN